MNRRPIMLCHTLVYSWRFEISVLGCQHAKISVLFLPMNIHSDHFRTKDTYYLSTFRDLVLPMQARTPLGQSSRDQEQERSSPCWDTRSTLSVSVVREGYATVHSLQDGRAQLQSSSTRNEGLKIQPREEPPRLPRCIGIALSESTMSSRNWTMKKKKKASSSLMHGDHRDAPKKQGAGGEMPHYLTRLSSCQLFPPRLENAVKVSSRIPLTRFRANPMITVTSVILATWN